MILKKPELINVVEDADIISCDGGGGPNGHPLVFYSFGQKKSVRCSYCGRIFVKAEQVQQVQRA
jgi:NADH dehydrogenase (ubiquinone) Fe-S protein 6